MPRKKSNHHISIIRSRSYKSGVLKWCGDLARQSHSNKMICKRIKNKEDVKHCIDKYKEARVSAYSCVYHARRGKAGMALLNLHASQDLTNQYMEMVRVGSKKSSVKKSRR